VHKGYHLPWLLASLVASTVISAGCSTDDTSSDEVATSRLHASMSVRAETPGLSRVNVSFQVDDPFGANVELSASDVLEATVGAVTQVLIVDNMFFDIDYVTRFNTSSDAEPFRIRLSRADGSTLDGSVVSLRPEFDVISPVPGQMTTFSGGLPLEWSPAEPGRTMILSFSTACTNTSGGIILHVSSASTEDDGTELFDLGRLPAATDARVDPARPCGLDVEFRRDDIGALDPAFAAGGRITSRQSREIEGVLVLF
jgi:hypothetical protein